MTQRDNTRIGRRPVLKGAGVALAGLGGLANPVAAKKGGRTTLTDQSADILVYWSGVGPNDGDRESDNPNDAEEFGFPSESPGPTDGLFLPVHDPPGGAFDFGDIEMTPNGGTLHNSWQLFSGGLMASDPKPYVLVHKGGGLYESRGQVMRFEARELNDIMPPEFRPSPPAQILQGHTWRAVATDQARLGLNANGRPDPAAPEWGVTRIDFYHARTHEFFLSLLYVIVADDTGSPFDGIQKVGEASTVASELITGGRLNLGGQ